MQPYTSLNRRKGLLLAFVCLLPVALWAQSARPPRDSAGNQNRERPGFADSILQKIEQVQQTLTRINNVTEDGFNTADIERDLPDIQSNIQIIKENLSVYSSVLNIKNLLTFQVLMGDMQQRLDGWRTSLFKYNRQLVTMQMEMRGFAKDEVMQQLRKDSLLQKLYLDEIADIKKNWKLARRSAKANQTRISQLQANVSKSYFALIELQDEVRDRIRQSGMQSFSKEYNYLWEVADSNKASVQVMALARKSYAGQRKMLGYYFRAHKDNWLWLILIALVYFTWVFNAFRKIRRAGQQQVIAEAAFKYIKPVPVLAALVVALSMAPFFDLRPPSAYVEMMQFFLLLALTILFLRRWPKRLFYCWVAIVIFYLLYSFTNAIITPRLSTRIALLVLNIASVLFGWLFLPRIREELPMKRFIRIVSFIYIGLNLLAACCNLFGRISMAKVFGTASIYSLIQIIGLAVFIQMITEAFHVQMLSSRVTADTKSLLNYERIQGKLSKLLSVGVVICWLIIFTTNLNLYDFLLQGIVQLLNESHKIGSTRFTFGSMVMLVFILYAANVLQKYIGYFFGETEDGFSGEITRKGSRLVMIRLCVIVCGFLLAIAATGLPIDKITIVLGALGVGIGLGLQDIVNNLISGIILIFERPLQLGDYVEISDKKGRVKDIGIRASRLLTTDGAEVVVPNGQLLSGQLTNWTLTNDHIRIELPVTISPTEKLPAAQEAIQQTIQAHAQVMHKMPVDILFTHVNDKECGLRVLCWISNIANEHKVKSELLLQVYHALKAAGVEVS